MYYDNIIYKTRISQNTSTVGYATTNECYNKQFLSIKSDATMNRDATTNAEEYYRPT